MVTHSMKCVRSYYIHVGVSCVMDFFYEDDECAVWCARLEEGLRSNFFAALDDATSPRRYEAIEWVENYLIR